MARKYVFRRDPEDPSKVQVGLDSDFNHKVILGAQIEQGGQIVYVNNNSFLLKKGESPWHTIDYPVQEGMVIRIFWKNSTNKIINFGFNVSLLGFHSPEKVDLRMRKKFFITRDSENDRIIHIGLTRGVYEVNLERILVTRGDTTLHDNQSGFFLRRFRDKNKKNQFYQVELEFDGAVEVTLYWLDVRGNLRSYCIFV